MFREEELIRKAALGDEESFSELIDLYKNYVFAIILNFIKDHNEVENVAQEVFLQIYLSLGKYESDNFKGWIGKIAANKSLDSIRRKKSKFREETFYNTDYLIDNIESENVVRPEEVLIEKDNKEALAEVMDTMPEIYKTALEKFYFQDKSYEEIAEEEKVEVKTIASRLYRGKILLKEKWREKNEAL